MTQAATREVRLDVTQGLYVLRYVGSAESRTAPQAIVRPTDDAGDAVTVVVAPGTEPNALSAPGSSVVLVVRSRTSIIIGLEALSNSDNLDAKFSLDLVAVAREGQISSQFGSQVAAPDSRRAPPVVAAGPLPFDIVAHVSRRGDIRPDVDGWVAGPKSPSAIEGLEFHSQTAGVAIAGQFLNAASAQTWSPWLTPGSLIGSRRKASPLTGLRLKLVGGDANRFEINGEAVFLGAPKLVQRGDEVEFTVAGGSDPLVGLRIAVVERVNKAAEASAHKQSRVRVFR